jgi:hypothetical protein
MTERSNADLFEVLICQVRQDGKINVVLSKTLNVLPETELLQPVTNLLHRGAPRGFVDRATGLRQYRMPPDSTGQGSVFGA